MSHHRSRARAEEQAGPARWRDPDGQENRCAYAVDIGLDAHACFYCVAQRIPRTQIGGGEPVTSSEISENGRPRVLLEERMPEPVHDPLVRQFFVHQRTGVLGEASLLL